MNIGNEELINTFKMLVSTWAVNKANMVPVDHITEQARKVETEILSRMNTKKKGVSTVKNTFTISEEVI